MPREAPIERRDKELASRTSSKLYKDLVEVCVRLQNKFYDQSKRSDDILDYWDIYNCKLNNHNFYNGQSAVYVPIVRSAVMARKTRFLNQLFPSSGRYIDATASDGSIPHEIVALLEHYIRRSQLRTQVIGALLRNGDVEGHYHLYVDWDRSERHVVWREIRPPRMKITGITPEPTDTEIDGEIEDLVEETLVDEGPSCEVLHDPDVLVTPPTAASIDNALAQGGEVAIIRRWTKETLRRMIERGEVMKGPGEHLLELSTRPTPTRDIDSAMIDSAGIKGKGEYFQGYEIWKVLEIEGGRRLCKILYGGYDLILSAKRNPNWNDRCSLLSAPQEKVAGSFKGQSPISGGVDSIQYHANQIAQQAADSTTYSMLPIIMTDPAKNPRTSTMLLNCAAIWEVDPNSTKFAEFPKLWQDALPIIQSDMQLVFQLMSVTPAMLPQQSGKPGAKRNQAEVAMEQQVDILTVAEACSVIEEGIMTPFLETSVELDAQYRSDNLTVRTFGEAGVAAKMERVRPLQSTTRYNFTWYGVEQARNSAQMQQQIAFLNVARSMGQDLQKAGKMLDPSAPLEHAAGNIFGWRMGRLVVKDIKSQLGLDPEMENGMLREGFAVEVHAADDDPRHILSHMKARQATGDPTGAFRIHIQKHQMQLQLRNAAAPQQPGMGQQQQGNQGPGQAAPGAQPQGTRPTRGPPGMIAPEAMPRAGGIVAPRRL